MVYEESAGIIPLQKRSHKWWVFLVQLYAGHWGFPKGHIEKGESPQETAARELFEETGLVVKKNLSDVPLVEHYKFFFQKKLISKKVSYFLAEVEGEEKIQKEEIAAGKWVALSEAATHLTFPELRAIWLDAQKLIKESTTED